MVIMTTLKIIFITYEILQCMNGYWKLAVYTAKCNHGNSFCSTCIQCWKVVIIIIIIVVVIIIIIKAIIIIVISNITILGLKVVMNSGSYERQPNVM